MGGRWKEREGKGREVKGGRRRGWEKVQGVSSNSWTSRLM